MPRRHECRERGAHGKPCPYCNRLLDTSKPMKGNDLFPTRDHVIPQSRLYNMPVYNVVVACKKCNNDKANRTPEEWLEILRKENDPRAAVIEAWLKTGYMEKIGPIHYVAPWNKLN